MALLKEVMTSYGVNATYWKVIITQINWEKSIAIFKLAGWISEEASSLYEPIQINTIEFSGVDFIFTSESDILVQAYNSIKTKAEWIDALDV